MKRQRDSSETANSRLSRSGVRETKSLWAMKETVQCFRQACVPCAYKLMINAPEHNKENPLQKLNPACVPNTRPELCPRLSKPLENTKQCGLYNSSQKILVVGDGNFSFSLSIVKKLGADNAANIVCTSYQDEATLLKVYPDVASNLQELKASGCHVFHNVDAVNLQSTLQKAAAAAKNGNPIPTQFDRIIFNFPCISREEAGLDAQSDDLKENQQLVQGFLECCGRGMIRKRKRGGGTEQLQILSSTGEVHITHKTKAPFMWWEIASLVAAPLVHVGDIVFDRSCYSSYVPKKVEDKRSFPVHDAVTHIFAPAEFDDTNCNQSWTLPRVAKSDETSVEEEKAFDWDTLERHPVDTSSLATRVVKLNDDSIWAVVSFLQFAAQGDGRVRLTKKGKRGGVRPNRRSKKGR